MSTQSMARDGSFSLTLPDGWSASGDLQDGELLAAVRGDADGNYVSNLSLTVEQFPPGDTRTSESYWVGNLVYMQTHPTAGYEELSKGSFSSKQADVFWTSYLRSFDDDTLTLVIIQYFIVHDQRGYLATCFVPPADYDTLIEPLHQMMQSIEFAGSAQS